MIQLTSAEDLLKIKLFGGIESVRPEERQDLFDYISNCPRFSYNAGDVVLSKGESNHRMLIILRGTLSICLESPTDEPIAVLEAGEFVGEFSMIDRQPASAFVVADAETEVMAVDFSAFMGMVKRSAAVTVNLMFSLVQRLRQGNQHLTKSRALRSHFEEQIYQDGLTEAYNRYWLDTHLCELIDQCRNKDWPFSLMMVDVDHFKSFNDTYGHQTGDIVLVSVAQALREQVRETDYVVRYGGEEFTVILPRTDREIALMIAERLRESIESLQLSDADGDLFQASLPLLASPACRQATKPPP